MPRVDATPSNHDSAVLYDALFFLSSLRRRIEPDLLRIPVGPGAVHVERYGHGGTAVVCVHGFGTCSFLWRAIAPEIAAAGNTAVAIDLLGYGQSDRPLDTEFGIAAQTDYLDRAMTALRLPRAAVVGIDLGGAVALRLAALRRERVSHLALINSLAPGSVPSADLRTLQRNTARFALRVARGILGAASLLTPLLEQSVADPAHMPPRLVARYLAPYVGQDGVNHLLALARAVRADDLNDIDPGSVRVPALVVRGESDLWLDGDVAGRLAASMPNGQLVRLPGVARLVPEEVPDQLTGLLLDFLEGRLHAETRSTA
ncbi:MAG TPA: alpha/beta hydrolase [Gemmatimonadaceae bacterium]|jgi:pimeloyl-ACP methyl ester carboxylesterase|nr:alpha/beta hydrolase [Gemmatimonadaceae bacterium]